MKEGDDSAGGFTVPEEFTPKLLYDSLETAVVRPSATAIPMKSDTLPMPKIVDSSHESNLFGGVVA
jgi:HK97 family phage major capsid protein